MFTGRRIDADEGGHGVTWNDELPGRIVPGPDGKGVASVFDVVHDAGGTTALFAGKDKFATFDRSWPEAIDEFEIDTRRRRTGRRGPRPTSRPRSDGSRSCTWRCRTSPATRRAGCRRPTSTRSRETDRLLGELLDTVDATPRLSKRLVVVLTADHGGLPGEKGHDDASDVEDYRIPFVVWGRGVRPADLYALNPDYADPGTGRPAYGGPQPVRNGDLANLVTELLGLGPVPGSELDADQDLDWR